MYIPYTGQEIIEMSVAYLAEQAKEAGTEEASEQLYMLASGVRGIGETLEWYTSLMNDIEDSIGEARLEKIQYEHMKKRADECMRRLFKALGKDWEDDDDLDE